MSHKPESLVSLRRNIDNDEESKKIVVKKVESSTFYRFTDNDESKLFRKFLNNWEDTWYKQKIKTTTIVPERNADIYKDKK